MQLPKYEDIIIVQGSQFSKTFHWYDAPVYDEIEGITLGYPTIIQATAHGLPSLSPTPILISDVRGTARVLNTGDKDCDRIRAAFIDVDSFSIPISTRDKVYQAGTGVFRWNAPKDLTGWTARMQIRENLNDETPLVSLTSAGGDISISLPDARLTVIIATAVTEALDFDEGVYDFEMVDPSGEATRLLEGKVLFNDEVTR